MVKVWLENEANYSSFKKDTPVDDPFWNGNTYIPVLYKLSSNLVSVASQYPTVERASGNFCIIIDHIWGCVCAYVWDEYSQPTPPPRWF